MKVRHAFYTVVALVSSVIQAQSSNVFDDLSTAMTVGKGNELLKKRDYEQARQFYDAAIGRDPTAWGPYVPRAIMFARQRKWDLAIQDLDTVLRLKPGFLTAAEMRGQINYHLGNYSRALADYDRIVSITPPSLRFTLAMALNSRAWLRATCPDASFRNGSQAVADAKSACSCTSWSNTACIDTLAAAHAEAGDFDAAMRFEQQAIQHEHENRSIKDPQRRLAAYQRRLALYQQHLAMYQHHQPCRAVN